MILATALAAQVDGIVTGDKDLLDLKQHNGIPIMNPGAFWKFEASFGK